MELPDDEEDVANLTAAIDRAGSKTRRLDRPTLPALTDELALWTSDDDQWRKARAKHWQSLLQDIVRAVSAHPPSVLRHVQEPESLVRDVKELAGECANESSRSEAALRRRLADLVDRLHTGLTTIAALEDAWSDLRSACRSPEKGESAARRLLALAAWSGHDVERLRKGLLNDLAASDSMDRSEPSARLTAAAASITRSPYEAEYVVWLRVLFAEVPDPPVIDLGPVTIYRGEWLRDQLRLGVSEVVPEAKLGTPFGFDALDNFCRVDRDAEDVDRDREMGVAYARVDLGHVLQADALRLARRTVSALAALGALNGAQPSLWQMDPSFLTFADGRYESLSFIAANVEGPTVHERVGMARDPTAHVLRRDHDLLVAHLPIVNQEIADIMDLLEWQRDARRSPPPARLVLCDRAIERSAKHAGIASPSRFVETYLIPSWAYNRIRSELLTLANRIRSDRFRHWPEDSPERAGYEEILHDEQIAFEELPTGWFTVNSAGLVGRLDWIGDRVEPGGDAQTTIQALSPKLTTGRATAAWFDELCDVARHHEARRSRTRNALIHGGPIGEVTVAEILPFAEHMANHALGGLVQASLDDTTFIDAVIHHTQQLKRVRHRLKANEAPGSALFWD